VKGIIKKGGGKFLPDINVDFETFFDGTYKDHYVDGFRKWDSGHARYEDGEGSAGFGNKAFGAKVYQDGNSVGFEQNVLGIEQKGSLGYAFDQEHQPGDNYRGEIGVGASASQSLGHRTSRC